MAITLVDNDVVNRLSGDAGTTFTITLTGTDVSAGDVLLIELLTHTAGVAAPTGTPSGAVSLLTWSSPAGGNAVSAGLWRWTVPTPVPSSITFTFGAAREGSLLWSAWRGVDTTTPLDAAVGVSSGTNGWAASAVATVNAPSVTTVTAGAQIVASVQIGSGSETITPPAGSTTLALGGRRRGVMVSRGLQTTPGSTGQATFGFVGSYNARAWQLALRPAESAGAPGAVSGATTSALTDPADRWAKPTMRTSWFDATLGKWRAILPTTTGHRLFTFDSPGGSVTQGAVVDSRQGARVTVFHKDGTTWVLAAAGGTNGAVLRRFNSAWSQIGSDATFTATGLTSLDAQPVSMIRTDNGHVWAAWIGTNAVRYVRSTDDGATFGGTGQSGTITVGGITGAVSLAQAGNRVVLLATGNDSGGRWVQSCSVTASTLASPNWTTETLPDLATGATSDDHLSMTVAPDGRVIAAAKTTNDGVDTQLIYLLVRSTAGTWTSYDVEVDPDDDGTGATAPGYTRPNVTIAYDQVVVTYGTIYDPQSLWYRTAPLANPSTWSARQTLLTGPNYWDGSQLPDAASVRTARGQFPVLAHEADTGDIVLTWMDSNVPPAPTVTYAVVGAPTSSGFTVSTKVSAGQSVRVRTSTADGTAATPDANGWSKSTVTGLAPATLATYDVEITEIDGYVSTVTGVGQGKSLPAAGAASFTFGFGSCFDTLNGALTSPNTGAFARLRARNPDLFFHLGDFTYADNAGTSQASHRADLEQVLGYSAALQDLLRDTATVYVKSDHDAGGGNNSAPGAWTAGNRSAALQVFPYLTRPDSNGLYHSFVVGRVRFIVTDTRYLVTSTSRLGATQKAWFKAEMQQPEPVKVWVQEATWIDNEPAEPGGDKWQDFGAEKAELGSFIATQAVGQVLTIHGDQHALSADGGSNNDWGGFPSFCAAPFRNYSSLKTLSTADWSEGFYPTSVGGEVAQHGFCTVTDTGEQITLALRGYDTSNTLRVSMDVVVPTVAPEPGTGPKVIVGGVETAATWTVIQGGVEVPVEWSAVSAGVEVPLV